MILDDKQLDEIIQNLNNIGEQRKKNLTSLTQALMDGDQDKVNHYAKLICGVEIENESN